MRTVELRVEGLASLAYGRLPAAVDLPGLTLAAPAGALLCQVSLEAELLAAVTPGGNSSRCPLAADPLQFLDADSEKRIARQYQPES